MKKVVRLKIVEAIASCNEKNPDKEPKTLYSVAEKVGISYHSLSRMNSGKPTPGKGTQTLSSLAQELDTTVDELLELEL